MNIFFVVDGEVVTPELTNSILSGVTRDSILRLCELNRIPSAERKVPIDEIMLAIENGSCTEVFGTGYCSDFSPSRPAWL